MDRFELSQKVKDWHLSERQVDACRKWAEHGDFRRAMIDAGYKNAIDGAELTQMYRKFNEDPRLQELVSIFRTYPSLRIGINRDQIVNELSAMAFSRVSDYMDWCDGEIILKESSTLTEAQKAAILEVSESVARDGTRTVKVKLQNKQAALDRLTQMLDEEEEKVKRQGRPGLDVLAINAGNVKMMLANSSTRKAIERLCADFFNYDLRLDPGMQAAIAQFTGEATPLGRGFEGRRINHNDLPQTGGAKTARELLEVIDVEPEAADDPLTADGEGAKGRRDPKNRVDQGRPAWGETEEEVFQRGPVEPDDFPVTEAAAGGEEGDDDDAKYEAMAEELTDYGLPDKPKVKKTARKTAVRKNATKRIVKLRKAADNGRLERAAAKEK